MAKHPAPQPIWQRRPDDAQMPARYELLRVTEKGLKGMICLSGDLCGCHVHYWRGKTLPCSIHNCAACLDGQAPRWRGYLCVLHRKSHVITVVELTAAATEPVDKYFRAHRSLRGAELSLWRNPPRPNGRMWAKLEEPQGDIETLPKPIDVKRFLCTLWGVHTPTPTPTIDEPKRDDLPGQRLLDAFERVEGTNGDR